MELAGARGEGIDVEIGIWDAVGRPEGSGISILYVKTGPALERRTGPV